MKKIIVIPADDSKPLQITEAKKEPKLKELQALVGGYIQVVPLWTRYEGAKCIVYANEEGKLHDLPENNRATALWHAALGSRVLDWLVGDVVIISAA